MIFKKDFLSILSVLLFALLAMGCSSSPPKYNVIISLDDSMKTSNNVYPSLEVDVVAVNQNDAIRLNGYSTNEYFQPGNKYRENLIKDTMYFSDQNYVPKTLETKNPLWTTWNEKGVDRLFIISNLPGVWKIDSGKLDHRRLDLPLDSASWPEGSDIKVSIKPSGLFLETPMNPPGKK